MGRKLKRKIEGVIGFKLTIAQIIGILLSLIVTVVCAVFIYNLMLNITNNKTFTVFVIIISCLGFLVLIPSACRLSDDIRKSLYRRSKVKE